MACIKLPTLKKLKKMPTRISTVNDIRVGVVYLDDDYDYMVVYQEQDHDGDIGVIYYHELLEKIPSNTSILEFFESEFFNVIKFKSYYVKERYFDGEFQIIEFPINDDERFIQELF